MKKNEPLFWETKHKEKFSINDDFLAKILQSCGVENYKEFIKPTEVNINSPSLLKNIDIAVELIACSLGKKIFLKVDPDVDGFTSSAYVRQFLTALNSQTEIVYKLDYHKKHGIKYEDVEMIDNLSLILVPDASGEEKELKKIAEEKKVPILIIDHHSFSEKEFEKMGKYATVVNCRDGSYPNPTLSGVGVVHKVFEAFCDKKGIPLECVNNYLDLVSLGCVADGMDLRNLETRYYVTQGLKEENLHNDLIKEMFFAYKDELHKQPCILDWGWAIGPKINGCIRYGEEDEQINLFRALCGEKENIEYRPRRKSKNDPLPAIEVHSLQKTMARVCKNVKARQDTQVRKYMKEFEKTIEKNDLTKNSVIVLDGTDVLKKETVTGLIANKIASAYQRPTLILRRRNDELMGGSGRTFGNGRLRKLKTFLNSLGIFESCEGHEEAFGVNIKNENVPKIVEDFNKQVKPDELRLVYDVDYEIDGNNLSNEQIKQLAKYYSLWGNTVPEPLFVVTNILINAQEITAYGDNNGFIRFRYNGVTFIKKYCTHDEYGLMTLDDGIGFGGSKKDLVLTVICQAQENEWQGNVSQEMKILHFYSRERTKADEKEADVFIF